MVFRFGSFLSFWNCKHNDVEHLAQVWRVTGWKDHLDDKQATIAVHRATTVAEDGQALGLAPIVYDVREQINIAPARDALEKTATFDLNAVH